jgi:hypothetical protein
MGKTKEPETFTVTGYGRFPLDMLRYDRCTPARQEDVRKIEDTLRRYAAAPAVIELRRHADRCIETRRWASFGWTVTV